MTAKERDQLRRAIDQRRRVQVGDTGRRESSRVALGHVDLSGVIHGTESAYNKGCHCELCRAEATRARRLRRRASKLAA